MSSRRKKVHPTLRSRQSEKLYARGVEDGGVDMGNTSALDIGVLAGWDGTEEEKRDAQEKFPLFREAEFVDCIWKKGNVYTFL